MKRWIIGLLSLCLLLSFCGCSSLSELDIKDPLSPLGAFKEEQEEKQILPPRNYISMIFYEDMDTHPLTAQNRENHEVLKLVYSPLFRLNAQLEAEAVLAESAVSEGETLRVTLKSGLKFSDGSALLASDVVYSYNLVLKNPASPYFSRLTNLKKVSAEGDRTVVFTLNAADVDFICALDVPIIGKNNQGASGPYGFWQINGKSALVPNPHYHQQPKISAIYLKHPANEKEKKEMFAVGLLDVYFSSAETETVFSGGKDYQVQPYRGDNLLYIGMNCAHPLFSNAAFRSFLNNLLERQKITDSVLLGQAEKTAYPFQPTWYKAKGLLQDKNLSDLQKKEQASALSLTLTEKALLDSSGAQVQFSLMVAAESAIHQQLARSVADSFALSGIKVELQVVSRADYNARLATGQYELYLGEMKTGRTLNTSLFAAGSPVQFSGTVFPSLEQAAANYRAGACSLLDYAEEFDRQTPVLPIAYRGGVLLVAKDVGDFQSTAEWSLYGDITKLITKETEIAP